MKITRPAWLEIDLDQLDENIKIIQKNISSQSKILSIVKSDGYCLGADKIVESLIGLGVDYFGLATTSEAIQLRKKYPQVGLLVLGFTPNFLLKESIDQGITLSVYTLDMAKEINAHAGEVAKKAKIHIALDTGMNRLGFSTNQEKIQETYQKIEEISRLENIEIEGLFTHFAVADTDDAFTQHQFDQYQMVYRELEKRGISIPMRHVSNSHAILRHRDYDLDYVRPGILQYGSREEDPYGENFSVKLIANLKALVAYVKEVPANEGVSYGLTYKTKARTKIATIPIGYADGLPRNLSNQLEVLIQGKRCKQIGRICMDQCMVDVTGLDVKVNDEVVLLGRQGKEEISIEELAKKAGEIPTSFLTHFGKRLPRVYVKNQKVEEIEDIILKF